MKTLLKKMAILSIAMLVFGCSKDGADGTDGINGTNGTNGNANVIGTSDFTITPTDWQTSGNLKYVNLTNNIITQSIVNTGIVMVYQKSNTDGSYTALPFSYQGIDRGFTFGLNYLQITLSAYNGSAITISANTVLRAVIISASNKMGNPNVNWNNYAEVKDKFKLKD
jgi:hypothetical protein